MGSFESLVAQRQRTSGLPPSFKMSHWSTGDVPDSAWCEDNFLLGAGMVVFQPSTYKIVLLYEKQKKFWFLPKGRSDIGESLEQTALREAYEESGYRVDFLPLYTNTHAPSPPNDRDAACKPNCEPIFITTAAYPVRVRGNRRAPAGEYITSWYVGQIPEDAVREEGTGMPDELNYETHLLFRKDAEGKLCEEENRILCYALKLFLNVCSHHKTVSVKT
ncbi:hypothetical protein B0H10DRAFT_1782148 [Mycena sp. CBHHK59/15]|nr:hypothetical protein B0H10DRAFT_1782148 [Mycena sp. CBHHK59/15]